MLINMVDEISKAKIKVIGIGGGGGNTANCLYRKNIQGVELFLINTDKQALSASPVKRKLGIGQSLTRGLGAGANPKIGRDAALESEGQIKNIIKGCDLLFLAVGMGGGTGTGASPEIGRIAREAGILTVAVTTLPFIFEGKRRMSAALRGIEELKNVVDTSIIIENQKVLPLIGKSCTLPQSFEVVDDILCQSVIAVSDLITKSGLINLDFADLRTVLKDGGAAFMVTGRASGPERSRKAASMAVNSPLMARNSLEGAKKLIINISGSMEMSLEEVNEAASIIHKKADGECHIIMGTVIDECMGDDLSVTVIATDFQDTREQEKRSILAKTEGVKQFNPAECEESIILGRMPTTVAREYESSNGRRVVMRESNLDYPTFLRNKKEAKAVY